MVNKPLIRPYLLGGGVALGGVARIPMIFTIPKRSRTFRIARWETFFVGDLFFGGVLFLGESPRKIASGFFVLLT